MTTVNKNIIERVNHYILFTLYLYFNYIYIIFLLIYLTLSLYLFTFFQINKILKNLSLNSKRVNEMTTVNKDIIERVNIQRL